MKGNLSNALMLLDCFYLYLPFCLLAPPNSMVLKDYETNNIIRSGERIDISPYSMFSIKVGFIYILESWNSRSFTGTLVFNLQINLKCFFTEKLGKWKW